MAAGQRRDAPEPTSDLRTVAATSTHPDDAASAGAAAVVRAPQPPSGRSVGPPPLAGAQALPDELSALADAIFVVQQRLSVLRCSPDRRVELSRALRRAIELGRRDPAAGRARLAALVEDLPAEGPLTP